MIDLYTWGTPNGHKAHIMLEELGLPYRIHKVNIGAKEQFKPDYVKINPNSKIPAMVDQDGPDGVPITVFESGAILFYLAEKSGKLLPAEGEARARVLEWLMFQMGNVGPMFGQCYHFKSSAPERIPYAIDRYAREVGRLYAVMDKRLVQSAYLGGADFSIADIACWPWTKNPPAYDLNPEDFPNVKRWIAAIAARPTVKRALRVLDKA
jgi:GST-like protein